MTKIIGLTGGIGSGKTTAAQYIASKGIPVYIADEAGKKVLSDENVITEISGLFGADVLTDGKIDRKALAAIVFNDRKKLELLNSIVHPAVERDFKMWLARHAEAPLVVKEAAILFESGTFKDCDAIINISVPEEVRIQRVADRDGSSREAVIDRMQNQWTDARRNALSDFVVENININEMRLQIDIILKKLNYL